jgi:hypothetical protein
LVPNGRQRCRHFVRIWKSPIPRAFRISGFDGPAYGFLPAEELLAMNAKTRIVIDRTQPESAAIFRRYAAKVEAIAALDRAYFATKSPSLAERAAYHQRQAVLERTRLRLYAELDKLRERAGYLPSSLPN